MGTSGISDKDAAEIIPYVEALNSSHNMNQELATALAEKLPASSLVPPGIADTRISLDVNSLRLAKGFGQKFLFSLSVVNRYERASTSRARNIPHGHSGVIHARGRSMNG